MSMMEDDNTMENGAAVEVEELEVHPRRGRPRRGELSPREKIDFDQEEAIADFISKEKDAGALIEFKRKQSNGKYAHLVTMPIADYDKERIAETYGGGEYRAVIRKSNGTMSQHFSFSIDHGRKAKLDENPQNNMMDVITRALASSQPNLGQFRELMTEQQSRADRMFQMMMLQAQENTKMMMTMMTAALGGNGKASGTDPVMGQIITALLTHTLKEKHQGIDQLVDGVVKLKQIAEGSKPVGVDGEENGGWLGKILEFLPQVMSGFLAARSANSGPVPLPPAAPVQNPPPSRPPVTAQTPNPEQERNLMIKNYVSSLLGMAENNIPVEAAYKQLAPLCSDDIYTEIVDFLRLPNWWEIFTKNNQAAQKYHPWFIELRGLWLDNFDDEPTPEPVNTSESTATTAPVTIEPEPVAPVVVTEVEPVVEKPAVRPASKRKK